MPGAQHIINAVFQPFDQQSLVEDFTADEHAHTDFREESKMDAYELIFAFHAWAAARPELEARSATETLDKEMDSIAAVEQDQEQTRLRLQQFVASIRDALLLLSQTVL
ncbi:hypothetical protein PENSPDRAFT_694819 [Peniophora sp. CONT]|nr:hypothetical protein PENSPDRAFT_694819 [Peniophora sp. CONT]